MSARTKLEDQLQGPLPALNLLSERECADLLSLFVSAQESEQTALIEAVDGMVHALPKMFQGIAKRVMFGDSLDQ